jgi:hypothetical protein
MIAKLAVRHGHGERSLSEVYAEARAPDRDILIFVQIGVRWDVVVLVALVTFHGAEVNETGLSDRVAAFLVFSGGQIDMDIGTVGSFEFSQTERALSISELVDRGDALRFVRETFEIALVIEIGPLSIDAITAPPGNSSFTVLLTNTNSGRNAYQPIASMTTATTIMILRLLMERLLSKIFS